MFAEAPAARNTQSGRLRSARLFTVACNDGVGAAVAVGLLSAPSTPFRIFTEEPGTQVMTGPPWIMVPALLLPIYVLVHLTIAVKLRAPHRLAAPPAMVRPYLKPLRECKMQATEQRPAPRTNHSVFHWPTVYDLMLRVFWGRAEHDYRDRVVQLACLSPGDSVLDVGSGTGTLAMAAKRHVGEAGKVAGIDASPEMVERARRKAAKAGLDIDFKHAGAEALPFQDAAFDAVVSTTVMHCLAERDRPGSVLEMRRVLKPAGRLLLVDFGGSERHGLISHMSAHRRFNLFGVMPLLHDAGFTIVESGPIEFSDLQFILAAARPSLS